MWLVIFALTSAAQPHCLELSLTVPKRHILVGEATKAVVTARAVCDADAPGGKPRLLFDDGTGYRLFLDVDEVDESLVVEGKERLRAGASSHYSFRMGVAARFSTDAPQLQHDPTFAFPKAGKYQVQASWGDARSNVVSVTAVEPRGEDARVFEELRKAPELLTWQGVVDQPEKARDLIAKHAGSPYLAPVQLALWKRDVGEAATHDHAEGTLKTAGHVAAVLRDIESTELSGTPFEVDRLVLVAEKRRLIGDRVGERRINERIVREHPETPAADDARKALASPH